MKKKLTETEKANIELNNYFNDDKKDGQDIDQLVNNNNISLVLNSSKDNDKDNEDM
ncbi:hypothetical protein [Paucisalibacillus sp. EB02]|uniref:hypothetical protein n=1 Tax=Paucisalibacillus sp. EB02 TaxID=1347087 RepID=UPI0004B94316|nr:hypothetical protein [Paucisalibacillus sp. EB02]